jgi:glycosyltransferase involved in cell wall biosynthesis
VFVLAWAVLGGAERHALAVARQLFAEGAQVEVLALTDEDGRFRAAAEAEGIGWHPCRIEWRGGRAEKARELARLAVALRRLRPDVVVPYCTRPNVLCGLVWRSTGASLCVWNQQDVGSTRIGRRLLARALRGTPLLIANSEAARDHLLLLGAVPDRVHVVANTPVEHVAESDGSEWRSRLGISRQAFVVTMLAHLHVGKDHDTLLRAWRKVVDRVGDGPVLLLAGRPAGGEHAVKALAFDLALGSSVRFLDDVLDVGGLLAATDVGVLSSRGESAPNAVLESMAASLPVVATDLPGIRELFGERQRSFLAPSGDADGLALALLDLYADADLRRTLGEENRRLIVERMRHPAGRAAAELIAAALGARLERDHDAVPAGSSTPAHAPADLA